MQNRDTRELETPVSKHKVVINTFMLGGEKRKLTNAQDGETAQKVTIESLVVSVNGKTKDNGDLMSLVDDFHGKDWDYLLNELTKSINDSNWTEKKTE